MLAKVPLARTALPEEIAAAVKFLIENDYITGQTIVIDGGFVL
jgi:3-oxoacyl-[acyl-carrier protein] reductase